MNINGPHMHRILHLILLSGILVIPLALMGQVQQDTTEKTQIEIEFSDNLRITTAGGQEESVLTGNVVLSHDSVYMHCDTATLRNRNAVHALGNIAIRKGDSLVVFSDTLDYTGTDRLAILTGEVVLKHKDQQLWTTRLEYQVDSNFAYYARGATLFNDSLQLTSRRGYYWANTDEARFLDSVVVIGEEFSMLTDSLHYDIARNRVIFLTRTIVNQGGAKIYCESGFYDIGNRVAVFSKNAQYLKDNQRASADVIRYDGDRDLIELIGSAEFAEDELLVTGDSIRYFQGTGETYITGNGYFRDSTREARGETLFYNRRTEAFSASGRSTLVEDGQELTADNIQFDKRSGLGVADGNVYWQDTAAGNTIRSDSMLFRQEDGYIEAIGTGRRPMFTTLLDRDTLYMTAERFISRMILPPVQSMPGGTPDTVLDTQGPSQDSLDAGMHMDTVASNTDKPEMPLAGPRNPDTLQVNSVDSLEVNTPAGEVEGDSVRQFQAFRDVRIFSERLQGLCDSLVFHSSDSVFRMLYDPVLWSDSTQFSADTIFIHLKNKAIDKADLRQSAMIVQQLQGLYYNQIRGKRIQTFFDPGSGDIDRVLVRGNAESVYYTRDEQDAYIGVNEVQCAEILFHFEEREIGRIHFSGGPTGQMQPMQQVDHGALRLEGFRWLEKKKPNNVLALY